MIEQQLKNLIQQALDALNIEGTIELEVPHDPEHGDFSTNIAMKSAKTLGKNPRDLAQKITEELKKNTDYSLLTTDDSIAGPGFINFFISDQSWKEELIKIIALDQTFGTSETGKGKTAITDTSHPNVAKPMMVHNTLSTIIGATINNLLANAGYNLIRDNYMGDWGTQYGKLTYAIRTWGNMEDIKKDPIPELQALYTKFHDEAEKHITIEDEAREEFRKMEEGDEENLKLWKWVREISIKEFEKGYNRLNVDFDMINAESHYEPMMEQLVKEGVEKGVITEGNDGALIIEMNDPEKPPAIIRKKDGASLYATRDLCRIKEWEEKYKADLAINVVDVAQKLYFEQLFEAAEKMGYKRAKQVHVIFGRMEFPGLSMSTRKGNVILFEDLLDEAEKRALDLIKEHQYKDAKASNSPLPRGDVRGTRTEGSEEQIELARIMGIGAIKYHILSQSRTKNYTFSWDTMLSFDGNSAPYLQYAYTRTQSLLKKHSDFKTNKSRLNQNSKFEIRNSALSSSEKQLIKIFTQFPKVLEQATREYKPNLLCTYLFELSQSFSHFYNADPILNAPNQGEVEFRLQLVETFALILKRGLEILGIEVPERM